MTKSIHEVAAEVLAEQKKPMTADEIFEIISTRKLYEFKAKSPRAVFRSQLRRHTANIPGPNQAKHQKFTVSAEGHYTLIK